MRNEGLSNSLSSFGPYIHVLYFKWLQMYSFVPIARTIKPMEYPMPPFLHLQYECISIFHKHDLPAQQTHVNQFLYCILTTVHWWYKMHIPSRGGLAELHSMWRKAHLPAVEGESSNTAWLTMNNSHTKNWATYSTVLAKRYSLLARCHFSK